MKQTETMNVNEAMTAEYLRQMTDEELINMMKSPFENFPYDHTRLYELEIGVWFAELSERFTGKPTAPKWLRHEGGAMPEGVGQLGNVLVWQDGDSFPLFTCRGSALWHKPLWYMVIPEPPAPPKYKQWRAQKGQMYWYLQGNGKPARDPERGSKIDDERWEIGNYFRTEDEAEVVLPAILTAFKQAQGGGE